jgi:hypothetical protein
MSDTNTTTPASKPAKVAKTKAPANTAASAEKRAATVASNRAARIATRGYSLPLVLKCTVTGKEVKYTSPTYIDKVISKFGSLEKLQKGFISRDGRRESKPAKVAKAPKAAKAAAVAVPAAVATP